jgi:hypothetical protein
MNNADLVAKLTPELAVAIELLCDAMPDATEGEITALLRSSFSEVYEANRHVLFELGLIRLIEPGR